MIWLSYGVKFRARIAILVLGFCTFVVYLFWNNKLPFAANTNIVQLYFDSTCKYNETCIYDQTSTSSMINDDEIVVARDNETGQYWTLGHVRRDPTSEAWLLLNTTPTSDGSKTIYPTLILGETDKEIKPSAENRTNGRLLVFNRVPKCATSMFVDLFWTLMKKRNNHFRYFSWKNYWERQLTTQKEEEFLEWITKKKNAQYQYKFPFAMDRHVYFIDSKFYNVPKGK